MPFDPVTYAAAVNAAETYASDAANIDIADAGSVITATTVEGALQEIKELVDLHEVVIGAGDLDWHAIQHLVRTNKHTDVFYVGDQFTTTHADKSAVHAHNDPATAHAACYHASF
jgi:hypothetical protein